MLRLNADVALVRQQGVVASWQRGVDAQQDRAEPVLGVDAVGMALVEEREAKSSCTTLECCRLVNDGCVDHVLIQQAHATLRCLADR